MKNGNGMCRTMIRRVVAVAGALVLAALVLPPPAAAIVPDTPCNEKCLADYTAAAEKCTEIKNNEEARKTCDNDAHQRYRSCRAICAQNDCLEHCKELCYRAWEKCREDCPRGDRNCLAECSNEHGRCNRECEKKCKK